MKNTKLTKNLIIFFVLILSATILTPNAVADAEQYLTPGITRDSTYVQDGSGVWTGKTPASYTRNYTVINSYSPVVGDVDADGRQEIIIIANNNIITLNYTTGVGLVQETSLYNGDTLIAGTRFRLTPALFDYDSDGDYDIISMNSTHYLLFGWNGTEINMTQHAPHRINTAAVTNPSFQTPVIKCAPSTITSNAHDMCITAWSNRSGAVGYPVFLGYDLDDNAVRASMAAAGAGNQDGNFHNTHVIDGDGNGVVEAYFARRDGGAGDLFVYKIEFGTAVTNTLIYTHNLAANSLFTDIIVNDLYGDGGFLDVTWGYSSDLTNFDGITINADSGALEDASYCTVLTCPEGNQIGGNMVEATDTTYCDFSGDVYYYVRNYNQNDPGANIDSVLCLSQYAGAGFKRTNVINSIHNFSSSPIIHQADLHGTTGLLLPGFTTQGGTAQSLPATFNLPFNVPVDAQMTGTLDIIGLGIFGIVYYDDAYTNQALEITGLAWDTGNPVCQYELPTFTLTLTDSEDDSGNCYYTETLANGTVSYTSSNATISEGDYVSHQAIITFNHYVDLTGTFTLTFYCKDQYHSAYDSKIYTVIVTNTTGCKYKGIGGGETTEDSEAAAEAEAGFQDNVTDSLEDIGIVSSSGKAMFWLILMICLAFLIFSAYKGEGVVYIIAFLEVMMLVLGWVLGMVGTVVLVIVGLMSAVILTFLWMRGPGSGG